MTPPPHFQVKNSLKRKFEFCILKGFVRLYFHVTSVVHIPNPFRPFLLLAKGYVQEVRDKCRPQRTSRILITALTDCLYLLLMTVVSRLNQPEQIQKYYQGIKTAFKELIWENRGR